MKCEASIRPGNIIVHHFRFSWCWCSVNEWGDSLHVTDPARSLCLYCGFIRCHFVRTHWRQPAAMNQLVALLRHPVALVWLSSALHCPFVSCDLPHDTGTFNIAISCLTSARTVGTVSGDFEQNLSPVVAKLMRHASVVLCHESTDVMQVVKPGAVQSNHEFFERRVENDVRQSRVPVAELNPPANRSRRVANVWIWNVLLQRMWR